MSKPVDGEELVHAEVVDGIGIATLTDPQKRNALSAVMMEQLQEKLARFAADKVRVVILGDDPDARVFSAGHNIHELRTDTDPLGYNEPLEKSLRAIRTYPGPVIAMVHGSVWGALSTLSARAISWWPTTRLSSL
jgi:methylmalonyl-CoA decarboxylase